MDNIDKIKYYSFNIETSTNNVNEGIDNETKADYQSSEYNSIALNSDVLMDFGNKYYSMDAIKYKYNELLNEFVEIESAESEQKATNIYNKMMLNEGDDTNERSAVLEYVNYGRYNKDIINNFINKVNNSEEISNFSLELPNID